MEGRIRLFEQDIYAREVEPVIVRRQVGMVFQKSNPFPTMSISENVLVGLKLNGVRDRAVLEERLEKSLEMAALWDEVKDRWDRPRLPFRVANNNGCALPAPWLCSRRCC